ncbi:hypothetical protein BCR36DRAFT_21043 [Piromyces finnis]|uniref:Uncharacterized protein n=1 Tax=Piromyces finnis TaxID=1754191 RepID=A0A1Y1VER1_9FUNG|nr:hypothetical protein BCR36DRAFT_21043 [Piromyces finnis]|eukprot:ORX53800.1 hypothetical protein BCR36DRAFT_21043 [Piromyces finnis]
MVNRNKRSIDKVKRSEDTKEFCKKIKRELINLKNNGSIQIYQNQNLYPKEEYSKSKNKENNNLDIVNEDQIQSKYKKERKKYTRRYNRQDRLKEAITQELNSCDILSKNLNLFSKIIDELKSDLENLLIKLENPKKYIEAELNNDSNDNNDDENTDNDGENIDNEKKEGSVKEVDPNNIKKKKKYGFNIVRKVNGHIKRIKALNEFSELSINTIQVNKKLISNEIKIIKESNSNDSTDINIVIHLMKNIPETSVAIFTEEITQYLNKLIKKYSSLFKNENETAIENFKEKEFSNANGLSKNTKSDLNSKKIEIIENKVSKDIIDIVENESSNKTMKTNDNIINSKKKKDISENTHLIKPYKSQNGKEISKEGNTIMVADNSTLKNTFDDDIIIKDLNISKNNASSGILKNTNIQKSDTNRIESDNDSTDHSLMKKSNKMIGNNDNILIEIKDTTKKNVDKCKQNNTKRNEIIFKDNNDDHSNNTDYIDEPSSNYFEDEEDDDIMLINRQSYCNSKSKSNKNTINDKDDKDKEKINNVNDIENNDIIDDIDNNVIEDSIIINDIDDNVIGDSVIINNIDDNKKSMNNKSTPTSTTTTTNKRRKRRGRTNLSQSRKKSNTKAITKKPELEIIEID